jgi:hypothetical protein
MLCFCNVSFALQCLALQWLCAVVSSSCNGVALKWRGCRSGCACLSGNLLRVVAQLSISNKVIILPTCVVSTALSDILMLAVLPHHLHYRHRSSGSAKTFLGPLQRNAGGGGLQVHGLVAVPEILRQWCLNREAKGQKRQSVGS